MKTKKEKKAPVHVMVEQPLQLRKLILSAAIDATKLLKEYEEFVALKERKLKTLRYLHKEMRNIKSISKEFDDRHFPQIPHELPVEHRKVHTLKSVPKIVEAPKTVTLPKKPVSEIERLNSELREIEEKLGSL